jgi:hypothetical protein
MKAEISFDLVMEGRIEFVEGTYRLADQDWQVFVFIPDPSQAEPKVSAGRWGRGATGLIVAWPASQVLNRAAVLEVMGGHLGVTEWVEVRGPDSMGLR